MFKVILAVSLILASSTSVLAERGSSRNETPNTTPECVETPVKGCTRRK